MLGRDACDASVASASVSWRLVRSNHIATPVGLGANGHSGPPSIGLLDMSATAETPAPSAGAAPGFALVVLDHGDKWFGEMHVLQDINLSITRGEVVVVIGPSGSGKSTLCRAI